MAATYMVPGVPTSNTCQSTCLKMMASYLEQVGILEATGPSRRKWETTDSPTLELNRMAGGPSIAALAGSHVHLSERGGGSWHDSFG